MYKIFCKTSHFFLFLFIAEITTGEEGLGWGFQAGQWQKHWPGPNLNMYCSHLEGLFNHKLLDLPPEFLIY